MLFCAKGQGSSNTKITFLGKRTLYVSSNDVLVPYSYQKQRTQAMNTFLFELLPLNTSVLMLHLSIAGKKQQPSSFKNDDVLRSTFLSKCHVLGKPPRSASILAQYKSGLDEQHWFSTHNSSTPSHPILLKCSAISVTVHPSVRKVTIWRMTLSKSMGCGPCC